MLSQYIALAAVVFGVNLLPAFGPPTWAVLLLYRFNSDLAAAPLVLVGALAAASGRYVLARLSPPLPRAHEQEADRGTQRAPRHRGNASWAIRRRARAVRAVAGPVGPAVRGGGADGCSPSAAHGRVLRRQARVVLDLR